MPQSPVQSRRSINDSCCLLVFGEGDGRMDITRHPWTLSAGSCEKEVALRYLWRWGGGLHLLPIGSPGDWPGTGGDGSTRRRSRGGGKGGRVEVCSGWRRTRASVSLNQGVRPSAVRKWPRVLLLLDVIIRDKNQIKRREREAEAG